MRNTLEDLRTLNDSLWRQVHDGRWWAGDGGWHVQLGLLPQKQAVLGLCWGAENVQGGSRVVMPLNWRHIVDPYDEGWATRPSAAGQILSMCCKQYSDLVSGQSAGQPIGTQGGCSSRVVSSWSLELESTRAEVSRAQQRPTHCAHWLPLAGSQAASM